MLLPKRPQTRWRVLFVIVAMVLFGTAFDLRYRQARAADPQPAEASPAAIDYAEKISTLVEQGKIDELAKLDSSTNDPATEKLQSWKTTYVSLLQKSDQQREEEYSKTVAKAQDELKNNKYEDAIANTVSAYLIAKDRPAFLELPWVSQLAEKIAAKAKEYEDAGRWLESLQLYSDLNSLYEIDTRYKADMQRLARRTRLLALYTPKALFDMRKSLLAKNAATEPSATSPDATQPEQAEDPSFPKWQDYVSGVDADMMHQALENAKNNWVENMDYETLLHGGVDALRLFLTTPELASEFPGVANADARDKFGKSLDDALAQIDPSRPLTQSSMEGLVDDIMQANRKTIKLPDEVAIMEFTDGAMEKLDPFTAVIWPHDVDEFEKTTSGKFGGVGIQISLENGLLKVISPLEDTPAYKAGIEAGDVVTAIDGKTTVGITIDEAVHEIMGQPDTKVVLRIKREGVKEPKDYALNRAEIHVISVKGFRRGSDDVSWDFMIDPDNKIGYIRITGFQNETAAELRAALETLKKQGVRGVILDLRFNPGGLLNAAVEISNMFVDHGVILSTKGRTTGVHRWRANPDTVLPNNVPVVVLINQYSASASEIFSGAMKDLNRGKIVGQRSFGKGSVQNLIHIGTEGTPGHDALMKLTMSYYYLPNGESLHRRDRDTKWGVDPDVSVELTTDQLKELVKQRRDSEIIHASDQPAASQPATMQAADVSDTQLDTALLMLRLQLVQLRT